MRDVDFLPERIRSQRERRKRLLRQGYLLATCVLLMVVLTYVRHGRIRQARAELAVLENRSADMAHQIAQITPLEKQMGELFIKKRIGSELGSRTDTTAVLAEMCRLMPANMVLLSLELKTLEVKADPAARVNARPTAREGAGADELVKRVRLVLTGLAPSDVDVANFIGQLCTSCLFEDVNMGYAKSIAFRGRVAREFQASCYLAK